MQTSKVLKTFEVFHNGVVYNRRMAKKRLDVVMVEMGLAETRSLAQRLVMAGKVRIDGQVAMKASQNVPDRKSVV